MRTDPAGEPPRLSLAGTRLVIIRHGEAACNAEDFIGGHQSCRGLTERGIGQVEALGRRLGRNGELDGLAALWTSVLPRAIETAAIVASALGVGTAEQTCSLCERHPGEADGLTWSDYEERYGRSSMPGVGPDVPLSPGGETWSQFVGRATRALEELASAHRGRLIVVVAHGGIVDASLVSFLGLAPHGAGIRFHADNSSLTEWLHTGPCWQLRRYNDASHLQGSGLGHLRAPPPAWVMAAGPKDAGQQA